MKTIIKKELRWRWLLISAAVLFLLSFFLIPYTDWDAIAFMVIAVLASVFWVFLVIYLIYCFPLLRDLRWLKKNNMEDIAQDIDMTRPLSNGKKCKLYCGKRAMICTAPCHVIPYSRIGWVYIYKQTAYGMTVEQSIVISTRDGQKHSITGTVEECQFLLANYIVPQSPDVVIGYGKEQSQQFMSRNPQAAKRHNIKLLILGIVLLLWGIALLGLCIVNYANIKLPAFLHVAALLIPGGIIVYKHAKNLTQK